MAEDRTQPGGQLLQAPQLQSRFAQPKEELVDFELDQRYVYRGQFYNPGDKIPEGLARNIEERRKKEAGKQPAAQRLPQDVNRLLMPLPEGFPYASTLNKAGIGTMGDLREAIDSGRLDSGNVPGVGEVVAKKVKDSFSLLVQEGDLLPKKKEE